jgi:hypothetical protein
MPASVRLDKEIFTLDDDFTIYRIGRRALTAVH